MREAVTVMDARRLTLNRMLNRSDLHRAGERRVVCDAYMLTSPGNARSSHARRDAPSIQ
jgi:hypothetical protein